MIRRGKDPPTRRSVTASKPCAAANEECFLHQDAPSVIGASVPFAASRLNLYAQIFQDLEDGLYAPFPEEDQTSGEEADACLTDQEAYVLA